MRPFQAVLGPAPPAGGFEPGAPQAGWFSSAALALFAFGIPIDVAIATRIGSSSVALGAPLVIASGWHVLATRRFRRLSAPLVLLVAYAAWGALSVAWARDQDAFTVRMTTSLQLVAFVLLCWPIARGERALRAVLAGFVAGCCGAVASVWSAFLSGRAVADQMYEGGTRFTAEGFDPNDMGVTLAVGIPMAAYLAGALGRRAGYLLLAYVPLAGSAIVLSGSRGAAITAVIAVACLLAWLAGRGRKGLAATVLLLLAGLVLAWRLIPWDTWSRLFTMREDLARQGTMGDRAQIWRAGLAVFAHDPVTGVGAGGFPGAVVPALGGRYAAHSTLLSVAVELGLVGLLLFGGALVAALRQVTRGRGDIRAFGLSLWATWLVGSASLTWDHRKTTWLVLLLCTAFGPTRPPAERETAP